ncbi:MAG: FAD-binding protein, partial [Rhodococcus sp. (in: high G+C Gram-positive bacteria)]
AAGATFDKNPDGQPARTREGGHSRSRIVHAGGDATGAEVQRALDASARSRSETPTLSGTACSVLTSAGEVVGLVVSSADGYGVVRSPSVLLATGGLGQLYISSTNPSGATGDGIALALDAGAEVADLEFVQFHPTVLFAPGSAGRRPLVSEAVRGEGAHLVDGDGARFMTGIHPLGDLAPRDVVSRAIAERLRSSGADHVYLDARSMGEFRTRFPTVSAACHAAGLDPTSDLIPVAPAAHYSCGGIVTDTWGRTSVPGLFAAGEVARTGMHGANRLASNSLLEGLVVGERAGAAAVDRLGRRVPDVDVHLGRPRAVPRSELQKLMTAHAGVVRDADGLRFAASALRSLTDRAEDTDRAREDTALTVTASALVLAAETRTESRGCHTRRDHPDAAGRLRTSLRIRLDAHGQPELVPDSVRRPAEPASAMTGAL